MGLTQKAAKKIAYLICFSFLVLFVSGCKKPPAPYVSPSTSLRDHTPVCLVPSADGILAYSNDYVDVDVSHTDEGYLMAAYRGESSQVKLQLTGPDYMTYTYDLADHEFQVFPLSAGNGIYRLGIYENISGSQYATVFSQEITVSISNTMGPFLYPNQYVRFDASSDAVTIASRLVTGAHDDLEAISAVFDYVINNISYDYDKAFNVQSGYVPDIDEILKQKKGICLDYAAVMTSMLRSQQIPTRLEVGYAGETYHAWISTYVEDKGWINGIVQFDGQSWSIMDPTFAANAGDQSLKSFIGDASNYVTKYIY